MLCYDCSLNHHLYFLLFGQRNANARTIVLQGFIQEFRFGGGKVNVIEGVEGIRKHAPTRGVWGHAPPEN